MLNTKMIKSEELKPIIQELRTMELYNVTVHNLEDSKKVFIQVNGLLRPNKETNSQLAYTYEIKAQSLIDFLEVNDMQQIEIKCKSDGFSCCGWHKDYSKRYFTSFGKDSLIEALQDMEELPSC